MRSFIGVALIVACTASKAGESPQSSPTLLPPSSVDVHKMREETIQNPSMASFLWFYQPTPEEYAKQCSGGFLSDDCQNMMEVGAMQAPAVYLFEWTETKPKTVHTDTAMDNIVVVYPVPTLSERSAFNAGQTDLGFYEMSVTTPEKCTTASARFCVVQPDLTVKEYGATYELSKGSSVNVGETTFSKYIEGESAASPDSCLTLTLHGCQNEAAEANLNLVLKSIGPIANGAGQAALVKSAIRFTSNPSPSDLAPAHDDVTAFTPPHVTTSTATRTPRLDSTAPGVTSGSASVDDETSFDAFDTTLLSTTNDAEVPFRRFRLGKPAPGADVTHLITTRPVLTLPTESTGGVRTTSQTSVSRPNLSETLINFEHDTAADADRA